MIPDSTLGFGIYVHWPFCAAKCPYCDFNSHVRAQVDESAWLGGILRELRHVRYLQDGASPVVTSMFFGGGTPSLMNGEAVGAVIDQISRLWTVANDVEITLESNPASVDAGRFRDYRTAGVNRLSLGVQALDDADLKALGRLHNVSDAEAALKLAMQTFDHVSLDLIYARPHQTLESWRAELTRALAFETEHVSLYQLTVEPATPYAALARTGRLQIPDDDAAAALYEITLEVTEAAGRPAYEISNHSRPGAECRHNLLYWRYGDFAGVGPGAHGRLTINGRRIATSGERLPERWRQLVQEHGHGFVEQYEILDREAAREHLLMNLRISEGIDIAAYEARWGAVIDRDAIRTLDKQGFLHTADRHIAATAKGRIVLNTVIDTLCA